MSWAVFDVQPKRRPDGTPYTRATLIAQAVYEREEEAIRAARRLKRTSGCSWRLAVRPLGPRDGERVLWPLEEAVRR